MKEGGRRDERERERESPRSCLTCCVTCDAARDFPRTRWVPRVMFPGKLSQSSGRLNSRGSVNMSVNDKRGDVCSQGAAVGAEAEIF